MAGFRQFLRDRGKSETYIRFAQIAFADRVPETSWSEYWKKQLGGIGVGLASVLICIPAIGLPIVLCDWAWRSHGLPGLLGTMSAVGLTAFLVSQSDRLFRLFVMLMAAFWLFWVVILVVVMLEKSGLT
jgi:hypothetical protein